MRFAAQYTLGSVIRECWRLTRQLPRPPAMSIIGGVARRLAEAVMEEFDRVQFDQADVDNLLARLPAAQLDRLPFGAIELDAAGVILKYNETEAKLSGRSAARVVGRNFFDDVAPCTNSPAFRGRFDKLVAGGPSAVFDYQFDYKMAPRAVRVHMKRALLGDTYWVLVSWTPVR